MILQPHHQWCWLLRSGCIQGIDIFNRLPEKPLVMQFSNHTQRNTALVPWTILGECYVHPFCSAIFIKEHTLTSYPGPINLISLLMSVLISHSSKWREISQKPLWFLEKWSDCINNDFVFIMWAEDKINLLCSGLRQSFSPKRKAIKILTVSFYLLTNQI